MKPKHLAIYINSGELFLSHRQHLAKGAMRAGFDVTVICPSGDGAQKVAAAGYNVRPVLLSRKDINPITELNSIIQSYRLIKSLKADIVHNFTIKCVLYGTIAARLAGIPLIVNTVTGRGHIFIDSSIKVRILRTLIGFAYRIAFSKPQVRFIFQNPDDYSLYIDNGWVSKRQAKIIPGTGVDTNVFTPPEFKSNVNIDAPQILFAARLLREKGLVELIEACDQLWQNGLRFRLVICGPLDADNPSGITKCELEKMEDRPFVEYRGLVRDMASQYQQCEIVCLPSYAEGLPLTLIEAGACGCALIATDVPGCRDIVEHGVNGLLVEPRQSESIAQALRQLIESPDQRRVMGERARQMTKAKFDKDILVALGLKEYDVETIAA